jgi:hypothetical protein
VAGVVLCGTLTACGSPPEPPAPFARGERIPLGMLSLEVRRSQEMQSMPRPYAGEAQAGEKLVAVFVYWRGLDDFDEFSRETFVDSFLCRRLRIVDSAGYEYGCMLTMPVDRFVGRPSPKLAREWVVVFRVWVDSEGLALHVEHPDPPEGSFRVARVPLSYAAGGGPRGTASLVPADHRHARTTPVRE